MPPTTGSQRFVTGRLRLHPLTVDDFVVEGHLERRAAGDQHARHRFERHRHQHAGLARITPHDVDAPRPERRRLRQLAFDPHEIALVRVDEDRPFDEQHVLALGCHEKRGQAVGGWRAVLKRVVLVRERGVLRFAVRPHLLLAFEPAKKDAFADVARPALRHDLVAEAVGVVVFGPHIHRRGLMEMRVGRFEVAEGAIFDGGRL